MDDELDRYDARPPWCEPFGDLGCRVTVRGEDGQQRVGYVVRVDDETQEVVVRIGEEP